MEVGLVELLNGATVDGILVAGTTVGAAIDRLRVGTKVVAVVDGLEVGTPSGWSHVGVDPTLRVCTIELRKQKG